WHLDLFRNLSEISLTMREPIEPGQRGEQHARQYEEWRSVARYPELVAGVSIVRRTAGGREEVERVAPVPARLDRAAWPPAVERVVGHLHRAGTLPDADAPQAEGRFTESFYNIGAALRDWQFDPAGPALLRPTVPGTEWLLVELDEEVLRQRILPDLAT